MSISSTCSPAATCLLFHCARFLCGAELLDYWSCKPSMRGSEAESAGEKGCRERRLEDFWGGLQMGLLGSSLLLIFGLLLLFCGRRSLPLRWWEGYSRSFFWRERLLVVIGWGRSLPTFSTLLNSSSLLRTSFWLSLSFKLDLIELNPLNIPGNFLKLPCLFQLVLFLPLGLLKCGLSVDST